jgi:SpoVK/Ycf46/Vps4 family AAA+-type ATPase
MEAQLKAERANRPAVVLIDEVDALLPRADETNARKAFNDVVGFVLLLNVLSLLASGKTHLVLLMATNHPEQIAPLLGRMSQRPPIYMGPPDQAAMVKIFNTTLGFLEDGLKARDVPHGDTRACQEMAAFAARLHALGVTGRALSAVRESALQAALRANKKLHADNVPKPQRAEAVDAAILDAIEQSLTKLEERGSQKELNAAYGRLTTARQTLDEVDQLMQRMGLKNLDPFEIVRRLSEQLLSTYVDPSQSVSLGFLTSRFYMTLAQLAMVYASQRLSRQTAQQIRDVRADAGAALFGEGDFKGKMTHVLKNTWSDLMRGRS